MPNNNNSNHIVINVNSNNKNKKPTQPKPKLPAQPAQPAVAKPQLPAQAYINNVNTNPPTNPVLSNPNVGYLVDKLEDDIRVLDKKKGFLEAYEKRIKGIDKTGYDLEMSLGALSQSRVGEENTLSLKKDNLEDKTFVYADKPNVTYDSFDHQNVTYTRGGKKGVRFGDDTMESLNNYYSDPANPTDTTEEVENFLNPMHSEQSQLMKSFMSNYDHNITTDYNEDRNDITVDETFDFEDVFVDPDRPTEPYGKPKYFNADIVKFEAKLSKESQLTILKRLDARTDGGAILNFAEHFLVDTTDDDNKQRKLKDIKDDIIRRFQEY